MRYIFLILFLFPVSAFSQQSTDFDDLIQQKTKKVLDFLYSKSDTEEFGASIVYSTGTVEWFMVLKETSADYREYFVQFKRSDALPIILESTIKNKENDTFKILFDESKYWKGNINLNSEFYKDIKQENLIHNNNSKFVFFDRNNAVVAEFVLPLLMSPSPLDKNQAYINKRMLEFLAIYIFN